MRSSTLTPTAFSRLRVWAGERSLSKMTTSASRAADELLELLDLAFAQIGRHVGRLAPLGQPPDHSRPGRFGQSLQFVERVLVVRAIGQENADEDRRFTGDALRPFHFSHDGLVPPRLLSAQQIRF